MNKENDSAEKENKEKNSYTMFAKEAFRSGTSDHLEHNGNPDYWFVLLKDITNIGGSSGDTAIADYDEKKWESKVGLDFGCGRGRNIMNLSRLAKWKRLDGVDISEGNIKFCKERFGLMKDNPVAEERAINPAQIVPPSVYCFYENNGFDLRELKDNEYDFVMSTIVLQHTPVHFIRNNLLKEIFRVTKSGGIFSFQMGGAIERTGMLGQPNKDIVNGDIDNYYDNDWSNQDTNGNGGDVYINHPEETIVPELKEIGFIDITTETNKAWMDANHTVWHYIRCMKP